MNSRYLNFAATMVLIFLTVYILFIGKTLLLPLVIALVFCYIIALLTELYNRVPLGKKSMPYAVALTLAIISTALVIYLFFLLLSHSIANIINEAPLYQQKLQKVLDWGNHYLGNKLDVRQIIAQINLTTLFSHLALIVSLTVSNLTLIIIYLLFLLLEYRSFGPKIKAICRTQHQLKKATTLLDKIKIDINNYLRIKTVVNSLAGIASYIVLLCFGIEYAEFWGVLIFLLHYIPFVGPIVAVVFVLLAVSVQITALVPFVVLAVLLLAVQIAVGNFLEPKWMGTRLNLSPLVILLSLAFWGAIWGIIGMFVCVPIMVIINIILAKFPKTRSIAVVLSATGEVDGR